MHCWRKFGENENVSNTLQDIALTMFHNAQTQPHAQNHYASSHTALGGGIKMF